MTGRDRQMIAMRRRGKTHAEIAARFGLATVTVSERMRGLARQAERVDDNRRTVRGLRHFSLCLMYWAQR